MAENHFRITEFCITDDPLPIRVADKILDIIQILNPVRTALGMAIIVSEHSGYRPYNYEIENGRSGHSQHVFADRGAVDVTCAASHRRRLFKLLLESEFTRVCEYPNMGTFHCDLKPSTHMKYQCTNGIDWERI